MRLVLLLFTFLFISCSVDDGKPSGVFFEYDQEHEGMVRIGAKGQFALLGTNESSAPVNDRPSMKVKFTYNYSISKNEMTRKEYAELMGENSGSVQDSGNLPQINVTYYDAVLYANARSVREGYDTAYTYYSAIFDDNGNCTYLENLLFNPSKEAYRLPTEAEWVFAASQNWKPSQGWNNLNSDYRLHEVCSADINKVSICDMAGNAMEWVNDWLGHLMDTTVTNFVGAPDGGSLGQRVVKGGSYHNTPENIKLSSRGDVYTVTSSTKADYVGFRLAFGKIPSPAWVNGTKIFSSQVSILASSSQVKSITGTYQTKLVFVNYETGNLAYIDFSNSTLTVTEIVDTLPAFHPEISPDGKRVAFSTKSEGIAGPSQVYVRDLNPSGSNLVRLDVESAAIPRFRVLPSGDTVIVYVSDAGNNKDDAEWKQKSTWQVPFKNGKFGKPVKLFDGSYHGGFSEDGSLAVTGARLLRANLNGKESLWYNGEQACNASLSKDSTKRTMFLDFGGQTGTDFVGSSYGTHERLLIADSTGTLIQSIAAPENFAFDHSEWSNIKNIAVSSVTNRNLAHTALYLISTEDSLLLKVVEGNELWHPSLWVNKQNLLLQTDLDLDSAGVYLAKDNVVGMSYVLRYKMELLWKYYDSVEIAITGSSRSLHGIIPMSMSSGFAVNFAHTPNDIFISEYFVNNYFIPLFPKLKTIIVSLDLDIWFKEKENDWKNNYASAPGYTYDSTHGFWKDSIPKGMYEFTKNAWGASDSLRSLYTNDRGYFDLPSVGWREKKAEISRDTIDFFEKMRTSAALSALENMIQIASASDVNVIGVIFPLSPWYKETGAFGRYGLKRSHAKMLIEEMNAFEDKYLNFYLMDENKMGDHDYTEEMAFDYDHLSVLGAVQLTSRLDSLLQTLE
jgi:uncharacterized protein (TIGR02171 family)